MNKTQSRPAVTPVELEHYREALRDAVQRRGLRAVARELEMSPTGLANFINGSNPYKHTLLSVQQWFGEKAGLPAYAPHELAAILRSLVASLRHPDREARKLVTAIEQAYADEQTPSPEWLRELRAELTRPRQEQTS